METESMSIASIGPAPSKRNIGIALYQMREVKLNVPDEVKYQRSTERAKILASDTFRRLHSSVDKFNQVFGPLAYGLSEKEAAVNLMAGTVTLADKYKDMWSLHSTFASTPLLSLPYRVSSLIRVGNRLMIDGTSFWSFAVLSSKDFL